MKNFKNSKDQGNKDYEDCINQKCNGKWFKYRNKDDNGFCRACIKNNELKE